MKDKLKTAILQNRTSLAVAGVIYFASFIAFRHDASSQGGTGIMWEWLERTLPTITESRWTTLGVHLAAFLMLAALDSLFTLTKSRTYSQTMVVMFLLAAMPPVFNSGAGTLAGLLVFCSLFPFFSSQKNNNYAKRMVSSGFLLGLASLNLPHALLLIPVFIIMMRSLQNLSLRNFISLLWGVALPFFAVGTYSLYTDQGHVMTRAVTDAFNFEMGTLSSMDTVVFINLGFIALVTLASVVHALRNPHKDKLKTRPLVNLLCLMAVLPLVAAFVAPREADSFISLALMPSVILQARAIVLIETRKASAITKTMLVLAVATFIANICLM